MNIATTFVRRARRLIAPLHPVPQPGTGAAATRPGPSPSDRPSGGGNLAAVHTSAGVERVHGGSDDLDQWPPTAAELDLAARWHASCCDPSLSAAMYDLCGSSQRAIAVVFQYRRERAADEVLARAFSHAGGAR